MIGKTRVFLIVLDGVGVGELPDAARYGDSGSDTMGHIAQASGGLPLPNLQKLGLGNIHPIRGLFPASPPLAAWGKMREASPGKDSITGHWEMMGIILETPFPTYPKGFPPEIVKPFTKAIGVDVIGNYPASGTEIIQRLGEEHMRTRKPILYTSADSVFQVAAHENVIPPEKLYDICKIARDQLRGKHGVGRVIARPFVGEPGHFERTSRRKDFPLEPPRNFLDELSEAGGRTHSIGKIREFFSGRNIASYDSTTSNGEHLQAILKGLRDSDADLIFANLEDFDMLYGHRNDTYGFAQALESFDFALGKIMGLLRANDILILTNDHGNDPTTSSTDHSREYAFLLVYGVPGLGGLAVGERKTFADIAATLRDIFHMPASSVGESIINSQ